MKKLFAGIAMAGTLATGGTVVVDQQLNPYTTVDQTLQIEADSSLVEGGKETIIADKTQPKVTLKKWGGEVALGVTYTGITSEGDRPFLSKNVTWTQDTSQSMEAVPLDPTTTMEDGGMEINIILNSPPSSNVFTFQLDNWENLDFFYQAPLWQEAGFKAPTKDCTDTECPQDNAVGRPENVVGSYAVYYKNHRDHTEGQVNYATGKAYHIYRPLVTDASGNSVWATLFYENGMLNVTVSQIFIDNATYPIKVDPTIGYTALGATCGDSVHDFMRGNKYTAAQTATIDHFTSGEKIDNSNSHHHWIAIYDNAASNAVRIAYSNDDTTLYGDSVCVLRDHALNSGSSLTNGTIYRVIDDIGGSTPLIAYDSSATAVTFVSLTAATFPPTTPKTFADSGYGASRDLSIYATYTASPSATHAKLTIPTGKLVIPSGKTTVN